MGVYVRVETMLPLAGWDSCGGLLERVAWAALWRCTGVERSHCVYLKIGTEQEVQRGSV